MKSIADLEKIRQKTLSAVNLRLRKRRHAHRSGHGHLRHRRRRPPRDECLHR